MQTTSENMKLMPNYKNHNQQQSQTSSVVANNTNPHEQPTTGAVNNRGQHNQGTRQSAATETGSPIGVIGLCNVSLGNVGGRPVGASPDFMPLDSSLSKAAHEYVVHHSQ